MKTKVSLLCISLLAGNIFSYGQQQAVEKAIQKDQYEKHGKAGQDKLNEWLGGNLMNVKPEAEYSFPLSVKQHVTTYKKGKVDSEMDMQLYINAGKNHYAMDGNQMGGSEKKKKGKEEMVTVFDAGTSAMLMYNLTNKTLLAMNMNAFSSKASRERARQNNDKTEKSDITCGKTGKTKTILGYTCYEYVCKSETKKSKTEMWLTTELKMVEGMYGMVQMAAIYGNAAGLGGAVLETSHYNDDGELAMSMTVTAINTKETFKLVTADFSQQKIPAFNFEP